MFGVLTSARLTVLVSSACRRDRSEDIFDFKKTAAPAKSHQSAEHFIGGWSEDMGRKLPLKETLVGQTHMMIFADGVGDMGNLQNRKTNIDSRYF